MLPKWKFSFSCDGPASFSQRPSLSLLLLILTISFCSAYFIGGPVQKQQRSIWNGPSTQKGIGQQHPPQLKRFPRVILSASSSEHGLESEIIKLLCNSGQFDEALESLEQLPPSDQLKSYYTQILKCLVDRQTRIHADRIIGNKNITALNVKDYEEIDNDSYILHLHQGDKILQKLIKLGGKPGCEMMLPTAEEFNDVIKMWGSSTFVDNASIQCRSHLDSLWTLHQKHNDERFVPLYESYYYSVMACSARDHGFDAAKRAESLLAEMESKCLDHPQLKPKRSIMNEVMNAWNKSGQKFKKGRKCEELLERMIESAQTQNGEGRDIAPDTDSFNIVLNALAQGKENNSEARAEKLLERMETFSSSNILNCQPDEISFNTVLNCWAMSRLKGAALRATAILDHMNKRYEAGLTDVHPDLSTYTTVLKAWARSRDPDAIEYAEAVFKEYQEFCDSDKWGFSHNAFTYNSMINCYAKSKHPDAANRALKLFERMKANMGKPGWELCFADIYTYTSLIDTLGKQQSYDASEQAVSLLTEVEELFVKTGDIRFQPNIRLYTAAVNAIGRSHEKPDRAKAIVKRVESSYLKGDAGKESTPDVVFYNALINAYGWSNEEGRSRQSFKILKHMIALYKSGKIVNAKPDTVSFNSVLNACVYDENDDQNQDHTMIEIVVAIFELLCNSEEYGRPDQHTYVQVLDSISRHMAEEDETRTAMAEATFLQCASNGLVGPRVVQRLHALIPQSRFQTMMGSASTGDGRKLNFRSNFDVSKLPLSWTCNAQSQNSRNRRRSRSRRMQSNFQVTKNVLISST